MATVTVDQVLAEISANRKENGELQLNRFNKKDFNKLMKAMLNDPEFTTEVAVVKKNNLDSIEKIEVSKSFRAFIKKLVEKMGIDKTESEKVLSPDFTIDNVDGLYEFFATAMYTYIESGNKFDLLPKKDFKGSIAIKEVKKQSKTAAAYSPQTREFLGDYETTKEAHKELIVKSSCPSYLKSRKKVN